MNFVPGGFVSQAIRQMSGLNFHQFGFARVELVFSRKHHAQSFDLATWKLDRAAGDFAIEINVGGLHHVDCFKLAHRRLLTHFHRTEFIESVAAAEIRRRRHRHIDQSHHWQGLACRKCKGFSEIQQCEVVRKRNGIRALKATGRQCPVVLTGGV